MGGERTIDIRKILLRDIRRRDIQVHCHELPDVGMPTELDRITLTNCLVQEMGGATNINNYSDDQVRKLVYIVRTHKNVLYARWFQALQLLMYHLDHYLRIETNNKRSLLFI